MELKRAICIFLIILTITTLSATVSVACKGSPAYKGEVPGQPAKVMGGLSTLASFEEGGSTNVETQATGFNSNRSTSNVAYSRSAPNEKPKEVRTTQLLPGCTMRYSKGCVHRLAGTARIACPAAVGVTAKNC